MRWFGWLRGSDEREIEPPPGPDDARDELLSAYLDGETSAAETAEVERLLADDPSLRDNLAELGALRNALASLGEVRAPRPFTLTTPPQRARAGLPRPELWTRAGAIAAAVAFAVVVSGDLAGVGDSGGNAAPTSAGSTLAASAEGAADEAGVVDARQADEAAPATAPVDAARAAEGDDGATAEAQAGEGADGDAGAAEETAALPPVAASTESLESAAPEDATATEEPSAIARPPATGAQAAPATEEDATTDAAADAPESTTTNDAEAAEAGTAAATEMPSVEAFAADDGGGESEAADGAEKAPLPSTPTGEVPTELSRGAADDDGIDALRVAELALLGVAAVLGAGAALQLARRRG